MTSTPPTEEDRLLYVAERNIRPVSDWYGVCEGEACIVCGLGSSLNDIEEPSRWWTFGVNDHHRIGWQPDFLVLLDRVGGMGQRGRLIREGARPHVATLQTHPCPLKNELPKHHRIVEWRYQGEPLASRVQRRDAAALPHWLDTEEIPHQDTTVFCAAVLAWKLGFRTIGVIGTDCDSGYAWAPGGPHRHSVRDHTGAISEAFRVFANEVAVRDGTRVLQLSAASPIDWGRSGTLGDIPDRSPARWAAIARC